jgi:fructose-1,6-bisphosphatase/inositol monophosphatase family enzyme
MSHEDFAAAIQVTRAVGSRLRPQFGKAAPVKSKGVLGTDAVTQQDLDAEQFLYKRLRQEYPAIGFIGEELGDRQTDTERFWLVDPVDGTGCFIRGLPFCTTMVALVERGEVVFSIINNFVTHELFVAQKGQGALLNGNPIQVSTRWLAGAYLCVKKINLKNPAWVDWHSALSKQCNLLTTLSYGYEFALIATGKIEGMICVDPPGHDHDFAAGALLVREAGGVVTNIGSNCYEYTNHNSLFTNQEVYRDLTSGESPLLG